jgi:adenosine kinase
MDIVVTGSIAYDYLMRFPGKFTDHFITEQMHQVSLSFLVDEMTRHWGGVAANIAYSMALLGLKPKLMGTAGRDFPDYRQWLESVGVDCSTVQQIDDLFTASFFCNTDIENNQIASFYAGAMGRAGEYSLADAYSATPDLVVISPNDPQAMSNLAQECRERGIKFVYDPSQQVPRLTGEELARDMSGAYVMVVNAYESEIISMKTGMSFQEINRQVDILVITQGARGSHIYVNGDVSTIEAFPTDNIVDPTGVGDAFRAGFIYGLVSGWPHELSAQVGSLCAAYVLEQVGTQSHRYSTEQFVQRFRTQYEDHGRLNKLINQPA